MAVKKSGGLGRGLEALFEDTLISQEVSVEDSAAENEEEISSSNSVHYIDIDEIRPNPSQPRRKFDESENFRSFRIYKNPWYDSADYRSLRFIR